MVATVKVRVAVMPVVVEERDVGCLTRVVDNAPKPPAEIGESLAQALSRGRFLHRIGSWT